MRLRVFCSAMAIVSALSGAAFAQSPPLTTTDAMIASSDPGLKLYIRNKHAEGMTSFSADKTLLFIHGATYPAETSFDLPIDGVALPDQDPAAASGRDRADPFSAASRTGPISSAAAVP